MTKVKQAVAFLWHCLRDLKPLRTFWQVLAGSLAVGGGAEAIGIEALPWEWALSIAAASAVASFISLMPSGQTFWATDEPQG